MIERTLILLKPDAVQRGLIGRIISRFEERGLKIIGMKMIMPNEELVKKHYEDVAQRRGEKVREMLVRYLREAPVLAAVVEGINAVELVRNMVGPTEPWKAMPGTIRGDFAHVNFSYADEKGVPVKNLIHASASKEEAENEISLWFSEEELHSYKRVDEDQIL